VTGTSSGHGMDAAAARVVVVADSLRCDVRLEHNNSLSLDCLVVYLGQHNLTLEWVGPGGHMLHRDHYSSGEVVQVARLTLGVEVATHSNSSGSTYTCRASFDRASSRYVDEANNSPTFQHNTCTATLPVPVTTTASPTGTSTCKERVDSSQTNLAAATGIGIGIAAVTFMVAAMMVFIVIRCSRQGHHCRRRRRNCRAANEYTPNSEEIDLTSARQNSWEMSRERRSLVAGQDANEKRDVDDETGLAFLQSHNDHKPQSSQTPPIEVEQNLSSHSSTDGDAASPGTVYPTPKFTVHPPPAKPKTNRQQSGVAAAIVIVPQEDTVQPSQPSDSCDFA